MVFLKPNKIANESMIAVMPTAILATPIVITVEEKVLPLVFLIF